MPLFTLFDTIGNERQIPCAGNETYELEKAYWVYVTQTERCVFVIR